jgi:NADPH:quinone reductase-like Zn-dependent oxidoreductase
MMKASLSTQSAIIGNDHGGVEISHNAPIPEAKDGVVLIRTMAVSVNPVDAKMRGPYVTAGAIAGCDFAGVVEEVDDEAAKYDIKKGDRVAAAIMGMNSLEPTHGAFAEHVGAPAYALVKLPDAASFESGSALCTCFMTAGLALFKSLDLPGYPLAPSIKKIPVLVYGGGTATGTAAIQLLLLAGFEPVVTCSPQSIQMVQSYGASTEAIFDYRNSDCATAIKQYTRNGLRYALDCISTKDSMQICYSALGRSGGRYTSLDPYSEMVAGTRKVIKADWVLGPIMLGKKVEWPAPHGRDADTQMFEFGQKWKNTVQDLLNKGLIREHPLLVRDGSLEQVIKCMEDITGKKVHGKKLVCRLRE